MPTGRVVPPATVRVGSSTSPAESGLVQTIASSSPFDNISVSITTSSKISYLAPTNRNLNSKKPIGATVGGVLGGILGLVIISATIFFCRRKRRNPSDVDLLRDTREINTRSPSPSLKEGMLSLIKSQNHFANLCLEWAARMDAAMEEAARQTERALSRAGSTPRTSSYHDTSGWHSPDTTGYKNRYGSPGRVLSPETPPPIPEDIGHRELLRRHSYSEPKVEVETEEDTLTQDFGSSVGSTTSRHLITTEEEIELERERRREEIFKQMRRVLDDDRY